MIFRFKSVDEARHQEILKHLGEKFDKVEENRFESIGPTIGKELRRKATYAIVVVLICIILYIAWAFRKVSKPVASWKYGVIAVIALIHDVGIPIGLFAVLGRFFGVEVNSAFVAAILTILGYSVNDTIVVFDRVRENLIKSGGDYDEFEKIVNESVNQTFARSINTTLTTLLALIAIFFWGGETIKYFALALIVGIGLGAYSSIFIASPLLVVLERKKRR
jgi:preprotein translocase subunit SecF